MKEWPQRQRVTRLRISYRIPFADSMGIPPRTHIGPCSWPDQIPHRCPHEPPETPPPLNIYNPYSIVMTVSKIASKRIPVTPEVWEEMSRLREPGQTYSSLLEEMIDQSKKQRLVDDIRRIRERGDFVDFED